MRYERLKIKLLITIQFYLFLVYSDASKPKQFVQDSDSPSPFSYFVEILFEKS